MRPVRLLRRQGIARGLIASSVALLLLVALACGPSESTTPATTANKTPTPVPSPTVAVIATPTPTANALVVPTVPIPDGKHGGVLKKLAGKGTRGLDPVWFTAPSDFSGWVWPVYNALVERLAPPNQDEIGPALATGWRLESGGKTVVFDLRQDVYFQDGTPFTADDVKYTIDAHFNPKPGNVSILASTMTWLGGVRVLDKHTVAFDLKAPLAPVLLEFLSGVLIAPAKQHAAEGPFTTKANGTGPFKLVEYVTAQRMRLERNPDYWRKGTPFLDGIEITVVGDKTSAQAAFEAGTVHIPADKLTVLDAKRLGQDQRFTVQKVARLAVFPLHFNLRSKDSPWADKRVRQAVSAAINRNDFVGVARRGEGFVSGPYPSTFFGGQYALPEAELKQYPGYEDDSAKGMARAKQLLADAGYASGFKVKMLNYESYPDHGVFVKNVLAPLGIDVSITTTSGGAAADAGMSGQFDWILYWSGANLQDPSDIMGSYTSDASANYSGWANSEYDSLNAKEVVAQSANRVELVRQMQRIILDETPRIILSQPAEYNAWSSKVKNFYRDPTAHYNSVYGYRYVWLDQ